MKKNNLVTILLALILLHFGCEKTVDNIPIPEGEVKLALYSYLNPNDSITTVEVFKSVPYFGEGSDRDVNNVIDDASVFIQFDNESVQLNYDQNKRIYVTAANQLTIQEGKSYTLKVSTPDGLNAEASTTVPLNFDGQYRVEIDSNDVEEEVGFVTRTYTIAMRLNDQAGVKNYYRLSTNNQSFTKGNSDLFNSCDLFIDDANQSGQTISRKCQQELFIDPGFFFGGVSPQDSVYFLNVDEAYYLFHESLERYNGDDGGFSEPVQVYSNVQGGLGCFGSYQQTAVPVIP